jgi:hypothetical protein
VALVVLAVATGGTAVLGAELLQAVFAAEARHAEAHALLALAVASTVSRALGLAVVLVEARVALALTLHALSVATAVFRANLDGAVAPVEALVARAGAVEAHTPE